MNWLKRIALFDPGQLNPGWQPAKGIVAIWKWFGRRVTGHSAHALNAWVVAWALTLLDLIPLVPEIPMATAYLAVAFGYTVREWPFKTADNRGDVLYVYAVLSAYLAPLWLTGIITMLALAHDVWYWFMRTRTFRGVTVRGYPEGWMPRDRTMLPYWRRKCKAVEIGY